MGYIKKAIGAGILGLTTTLSPLYSQEANQPYSFETKELEETILKKYGTNTNFGDILKKMDSFGTIDRSITSFEFQKHENPDDEGLIDLSLSSFDTEKEIAKEEVKDLFKPAQEKKPLLLTYKQSPGFTVFSNKDSLDTLKVGGQFLFPEEDFDIGFTYITKLLEESQTSELDKQNVELSLLLAQKDKGYFGKVISDYLPVDAITKTIDSTTIEHKNSNRTIVSGGYKTEENTFEFSPFREKRYFSTDVFVLPTLIEHDIESLGLQAKASIGNLNLLLSGSDTLIDQDGKDIAKTLEVIALAEWASLEDGLIASVIGNSRLDENMISDTTENYKEWSLNAHKLFGNWSIGGGITRDDSHTFIDASAYFIPMKGNKADEALLLSLSQLPRYDITLLSNTKELDFQNRFNNVIKNLPNETYLLGYANASQVLNEDLEKDMSYNWGLKYLLNLENSKLVFGYDHINEATGIIKRTLSAERLGNKWDLALSVWDVKDTIHDTERYSGCGVKASCLFGPAPKKKQTTYGPNDFYTPSEDYKIITK